MSQRFSGPDEARARRFERDRARFRSGLPADVGVADRAELVKRAFDALAEQARRERRADE